MFLTILLFMSFLRILRTSIMTFLSGSALLIYADVFFHRWFENKSYNVSCRLYSSSPQIQVFISLNKNIMVVTC